MALIRCMGGGASDYSIVEGVPFYTTSTHADPVINASVGQYLILFCTDAAGEIPSESVQATSDISVDGAVKVYKVITAISSAALRIIVTSGGGGSILIAEK